MNEQEFLALVKDFKTVSPEEAEQLLEAKDDAILFLGRETCPYCRRFAPKLAKVAKEKGWTVHFLNTSTPTSAITALRDKYQVPTVPGFLYAGTDGIKVRCDSSMTEEEIAAFVG